MKIIITGGAGMIGSILCKKLSEDNHEIYVIDNLFRGKFNYIENYVDKEKFFKSDLSNENEINKLLELDFLQGADVFIHLADIVAGISYVFDNEFEIFRINNLINTNAFYLAKKLDIKKIIYAGTACSFPKEKQISLDSKLDDKDLFPSHPESGYGWSKLIGQLELEYMVKNNFLNQGISLMFHNVYGPNCDFDLNTSQFIPATINKILSGNDNLVVWGSGAQGRSFVYVDDIVDALLFAINYKNKGYYYGQVSSDRCVSIKEIVNHLVEISGKKINISFDKSKPEGDKGRYGYSEFVNEELGWKTKTDLKIGLKKTYQFIKDKI